MNIVCPECGCPYNDYKTSCPECGCPTRPKNINETSLTNCPNCGAPIGRGISCEYCGSIFPKKDIPQQKVIVKERIVNNDNNNGIGVGTAAFIGSLIGGLLSD